MKKFNLASNIEEMLTLLPGNVYWKDTDCVYQGCNNEFAKILKLNSRHDIVGKTDFDYLTKDKAEVIISNDKQVMKLAKEISLEETGLNAKGKEAIYITKKIPMRDNHNQVIGLLGVSIDITALKDAQEREKIALAQVAEEKAKALAETELRQAVMVLSGSIAHDLRTPIAAVEMNAGALKENLPVLIEYYQKAQATDLLPIEHRISKRQLEALGGTGADIEEITRLMQDFIDITLKTLSKVLSGELAQEDLVSCSMWRCIHNTIDRYPFIKNQRDLIKWDQGDFNFMGNQVLMIRVLSNLLKNSLEQIEKNGYGEIFIATEKNDNFNILRFKDTAGGAPPEVIDHLFEGYRTTKEEGTGIGLAFCKLVINSFGGDIVCNSEHKNYIEFIMTFKKA